MQDIAIYFSAVWYSIQHIQETNNYKSVRHYTASKSICCSYCNSERYPSKDFILFYRKLNTFLCQKFHLTPASFLVLENNVVIYIMQELADIACQTALQDLLLLLPVWSELLLECWYSSACRD